MKEIHIPPEVVEAAARAAYEYYVCKDWAEAMNKDIYRAIATAALRAGLAAWPGARNSKHVSFCGRSDIGIYLPLPKEPDNAEG